MEPPEHARAAAPGVSGDPLVGRLLERRYRIGARVARGGMASVYEATDIRLDRTVAVKVMHPGLGDDQEFAERFVREARAAARLNHPHVVGVYDQGDDTSDGQDTVFLVMEYVPGHTLRDVVRKEAPMPPRRALALLEPVVSALGAAHRAGLIHRDVKPENVLIADEAHGGRIKVADFGLAKAVSADTQHTATGGVLIGTVSYLAPELVIDGRADARADVYAAGVVLYELLTGRKPHEGESPIQVAYRHVHHDVPMPSLLQPGIPDYVDALVARATSRDRDQRPADATVLLHHLHRVELALRDGLDSDPELAADLLPRRAPASESDEADEASERANDTTPEPFDAGALALLTEVDPRDSGLVTDGSPDRTTALERHPVPPRGPAEAPVTEPMQAVAPAAAAATAVHPAAPAEAARPAPGRTPGKPTGKSPGKPPSRIAPVATTARRRSRKGPVALLLRTPARRRRRRGSVVVRVGALHHHPGRARPRRGRGRRGAGDGRTRGGGRRAGVQRERRQGPGHRHRPRAGRQGPRRRHGDPGAVAGAGALRRARPGRADRGRGAGRHRRYQPHLRHEQGSLERDRPRGAGDPLLAQRRHHPQARGDGRPRAQPRPQAVRGQGLDGQGLRLHQGRPREAGAPGRGERGVQRHRAHGRHHLAGPALRGRRSTAARPSPSWCRRGRSWSRCRR